MRSKEYLLLLLLLLLLGAAALGCSRRAPGPEECVRFTELALGVSHEQAVAHPILSNQYQNLVVLCLTTPLDRAVIACAEETRAPRDCIQRLDPGFLEEVGGERARRPSSTERR